MKTQEEKEKRLKEWKEMKREKWLEEGISEEEVERRLAEHKIL